MEITRYGITTLWEGDNCYGLPKWAQDEGDYAVKHLLHCGGDGIYSFPLSSIEINEVVDSISYYLFCGDIELSETEEKKLRDALVSDTPEKIEGLEA